MPKSFNWNAFESDLSTLVGRYVHRTDAARIRRQLTEYQTLQETACNVELTPRQRTREATIERQLTTFFGDRLDTFNGDPRGATVKLRPLTTGERLHYFEMDWGGYLVFTAYRK